MAHQWCWYWPLLLFLTSNKDVFDSSINYNSGSVCHQPPVWIRIRFVLFQVWWFTNFVLAKRIRLPILMRRLQLECNFTDDQCGIDQNMQQFVHHYNLTTPIAGRCNYYQFVTRGNQWEAKIVCLTIVVSEYMVPLQVGNLQTGSFPDLKSRLVCLHLEYNIQGNKSFLLRISRKFPNDQSSTPAHQVFSALLSPSHKWESIDVNVPINEQEFALLFEVICQYCPIGSVFAISRILLSWLPCAPANLWPHFVR